MGRDGSALRRALLVGTPVGLVQAAIHQGGAWIHGAVDGTVLMKSLMSPLLSFALVWAGAVLAAKETSKHER